MTARQSNLEFAPPPTPGLLRGAVLAIVVHGLLLAALSAGVHWQREAPLVTAEAELWSAMPQEAAPPAPLPLTPAVPPAPQPEPQKSVPPSVPVPVKAPEPQALPPQPDPSIAVAREKAKQLKERQQRDLMEKEKKLKEKQLAEKVEDEKAEKLKLEKANKPKAKTPKDARPKPSEAAVDAKSLADNRAEALKRMAALAAGSGSANSQGTAAQSSGPSAGYAGRIRARIKPNITFTDTIAGNPTAEVEVRTSPDGTIISRRLTQSSGVKSWDDAVLSAVDKTEVFPRDVDGRVPPALVISFRPKD